MQYNYEEVIHIIQNTRRFGTLTGYEVSKRMLEQLGNPQKGIPFVHIAGTNGKGSTTAFLCEILKQAGIRVGMFTSPHLVTFEERIRINGIYIPKEDVTRLGNQLLEMEFDVSPTMFDYCLCMAVLYFKEQHCDLMVMETGIGGRFDSTNALGTPLISVITKIGFDHMAILGNTLEEIAYEKAGIIKKGVPVVLQKQEDSVCKVIYDYVLQINSENETKQNNLLKNENSRITDSFADVKKKEDSNKNNNIEANEKIFYFINNENDNGISKYLLEVSQSMREYISKFPMKMHGKFQIENAASAVLTAAYILEKQKIPKSDVNAYMCEDIEHLSGTKYAKTIELSEDTSGKNIILSEKESEKNIHLKETNSKEMLGKVIAMNDLPKELCKLPQRYVENIKQGIAQTIWKGRMELVNENPFFMIDGAHNPDGVHALAESLKALYPNEKFHFIMAVMADKDYETMIEELIPIAYDFVTVTPEYHRALQAKELAQCIAKKGVKARYAEKLEDVIVPLLPLKDGKTKVINTKLQDVTDKIGNEKINDCKTTQKTEISDRNSKTIAFGSLYFIGEIETLVK